MKNVFLFVAGALASLSLSAADIGKAVIERSSAIIHTIDSNLFFILSPFLLLFFHFLL